MSIKRRITVNLTEKEYDALQIIAARDDRSLAWLGRRAICDLIKQSTQQAPHRETRTRRHLSAAP